jgi:hypothetical protein
VSASGGKLAAVAVLSKAIEKRNGLVPGNVGGLINLGVVTGTGSRIYLHGLLADVALLVIVVIYVLGANRRLGSRAGCKANHEKNNDEQKSKDLCFHVFSPYKIFAVYFTYATASHRRLKCDSHGRCRGCANRGSQSPKQNTATTRLLEPQRSFRDNTHFNE